MAQVSNRSSQVTKGRLTPAGIALALPFVLLPTLRLAANAALPPGPVNFDGIYVATCVGVGLVFLTRALNVYVIFAALAYVPALAWALPRFSRLLGLGS